MPQAWEKKTATIYWEREQSAIETFERIAWEVATNLQCHNKWEASKERDAWERKEARLEEQCGSVCESKEKLGDFL